MFPKLSKKVSTTQISIKQQFIGKSLELRLDRFQCIGCGICERVCPKDAITFGPIAPISDSNQASRINSNDLISSIDELKCVFCGACTILCPFNALSLYENDIEKLPEDNLLITKQAIPSLQTQPIALKKLNKTVNIYWDGRIKVNSTFPESKKEFQRNYINKCPGDCRKCFDICPNEAISFNSSEEAWETKKVIIVDDDRCIKCRACQMTCPQSVFDVEWTQVNVSGPYNDQFWPLVVNRLTERKEPAHE